jgi:hypothetical protein
MITCGGTGGIIGAVVYRSQDTPIFLLRGDNLDCVSTMLLSIYILLTHRQVELFDYSSGWHVNVIFPYGEWKGPTGENTY